MAGVFALSAGLRYPPGYVSHKGAILAPFMTPLLYARQNQKIKTNPRDYYEKWLNPSPAAGDAPGTSLTAGIICQSLDK